MVDLHGNGYADNAVSAHDTAQDGWEELRRLLVGPEQAQLDALQKRLEHSQLQAAELSRVLPEAVSLRASEDKQLAHVLLPTVEEALHTSVRQDPQILAELLFPVLGPAIRRAISHVLSGMLESLNRTLESSFSLRGLQWRLESWRTGTSFAEVVLVHTLHYRVEQVFLIHRETGLLLHHVTSATVATHHEEMISGMLTAIQDFVRDSFDVEDAAGLETVQLGDFTLWIERGPLAFVAGVVRGNAPQELRAVFQEATEAIHRDYQEDLRAFQGDATPFAACHQRLEACLQERYATKSTRSRWRVWLISAALLVLLGVYGGGLIQERRQWASLLRALQVEPGIVLIRADKQRGQYYLTGLRDPLARDPQEIIQESRIPPNQVVGHWEPYHALHPPFVLARARTVLLPPETVTLRLDGTVLHATGKAPYRWMRDAVRLARVVPGITVFQTDQLENLTWAEMASLEERLEQQHIFFVKELPQLVANQEGRIQEVRQILQQLAALADTVEQDVQVFITGYADERGPSEKNQKLSRERAEAILMLLAFPGARRLSLMTTGAGVLKAVAPGATEQELATNRRVSFSVVLPEFSR